MKEHIEELREWLQGRRPGWDIRPAVRALMHEAADALEAKAAPVGEREAFETAMGSVLIAEQGEFALSRAYEEGHPYTFLATKLAWAAWQAAYHRAQQPQSAEAVATIRKPDLDADIYDEGPYMGREDWLRLQDLPPGTKLYTTPQPSAGVVMPSAEVLADLFVGCPLPKTVRVDQCALDPEYPHRFGTNLLTWGEAKLMFDEMLARLSNKEVGRG